MYKFYNAHPKNLKTNDCVKRALCTAESKDYKEVSKDLNRIKRQLNEKSFSDDRVWKKYVRERKYVKLSFPAQKGEKRMNRKMCI